jgi:hypothetical protein
MPRVWRPGVRPPVPAVLLILAKHAFAATALNHFREEFIALIAPLGSRNADALSEKRQMSIFAALHKSLPLLTPF